MSSPQRVRSAEESSIDSHQCFVSASSLLASLSTSSSAMLEQHFAYFLSACAFAHLLLGDIGYLELVSVFLPARVFI